MTRLKVLVVDDEPLARDDLAWLLRQSEGIDEVVTAESGHDALRVFGDRDDVNALFVDIQMPAFDGVELVKVIRNFKKPPVVAFVTAYDDYAVDAFDLDVCDYLRKPVDQGRLDETIRRMQLRTSQADALDTSNDGAPSTTSPAALARLSGRRGNDSFVIARDDVLLIEAAGDYVRAHTADDAFLVRESISSLTSAWSGCGFVRIHRSYLVRASAIRGVRNVDGRRTVDIGGTDYPVSRRYTRLLQDHLGGRV